MKNKKTKLIGATFFMSALTSHAAVIAQYEFTNLSGVNTAFSTADGQEARQVDTVAAGVTATQFVDGPGFGDPLVLGAGSIHVAESTGLNDGVADNMAGAIDSNEDYFSFSVTAVTGTLNLDNLTFDITRANNGANDYAILTSVDGFTSSDIVFFGDQATTTGAQNIDFSAAKFQGLSNIEIRIYLDDRQGNNNNSSANTLDNVTLNGDVVAVPEPSSTALLGLGSLALILRRRKK